jgi:CheY-like chemotaxis protein
MHGYDVVTAHNGETALALMAERPPSAVLLDIGMPGMNGYEVARRVRREPWSRDVVLIACTGWGQPEDRRRTQEAGFDYHLVKPGPPETVLQLLSTAIDRPTDAVQP